MRRLFFTILSIVFTLQLQAQIPPKVVKDDQFLNRLAEANAADTVAVPIIDLPLMYGQNLIYKLRLDSIQKIVPLSYNEYVQSYIDIYVKRKNMYGDMLGLSAYYFPIFEKALKAYNVPAEIKYLPIIESSMNPHAISRVGATGMWQFMFSTAKGYGLNMDNFVDERKDPIQASYAAAAYFRDAYEELGDWQLAIAAYNCGMGNVNRAIAKAGSRDFWKIRNFLPQETRNYVPAFIAAIYVMKFADVHQIGVKSSPFNFETDTVIVKNFVALADVAQAIDHKEETLVMLNPSYKKKIVNGTATSLKRIVMPKVGPQYFDRVFQVLNSDFESDTRIILASTDDVRDLRKKQVAVRKQQSRANLLRHKVLPGQSLTVIAKRYGVEVQDLKVWNSLKGVNIIPGQQLKIYRDTITAKSGPTVKASFANYKVKQGDTLSTIAEKFDGITVSSLKAANNLRNAVIHEGMTLKIR